MVNFFVFLILYNVTNCSLLLNSFSLPHNFFLSLSNSFLLFSTLISLSSLCSSNSCHHHHHHPLCPTCALSLLNNASSTIVIVLQPWPCLPLPPPCQATFVLQAQIWSARGSIYIRSTTHWTPWMIPKLTMWVWMANSITLKISLLVMRWEVCILVVEFFLINYFK